MTSSRPARTRGHRPARRRRPNAPRAAHPNPARPASTVRPTAATRPAPARPETSVASFAELGLAAPLIKVLEAGGISRPTPIQAQSIPDALAGRDLLGRAQTGSGKTLAFGLPLLTRLAATKRNLRDTRNAPHPRGLVLLPTRELAQQVEAALRPLAGPLRLHLLTVIGGASITRQLADLRRGVDVLVATPGRLIDLLDRRAVSLDAVEVAVLDEADHMADLGFLPAVTRILDATPATRQCLLFSATLDGDVDRIVRRYLSDPAEHHVGDTNIPLSAMRHRVFRLNHADKVAVAAEIAATSERALFFVRTKRGADRLAKQLRTRGIEATALHGNLNQNQRRRALDAFTAHRSRVLVATDVAARGIHIDGLELVVHFDPPADAKTYAHRSGRTARAGAHGTVVSLAEPDQQRDLNRMHAAAGLRAPVVAVRPGHPAIAELAPTSTSTPTPAPNPTPAR